MSLLRKLAEAEGYVSVDEMLEAAVFDSIVPAICTTCGAMDEMEPDQDAGLCLDCGKHTMKSCLILAGII